MMMMMMMVMMMMMMKVSIYARLLLFLLAGLNQIPLETICVVYKNNKKKTLNCCDNLFSVFIYYFI